MNLKTIIQTIKQKLDSIDELSTVYSYPLGDGVRAEGYPAVIFVPESLDSQFADTESNHRTFQFRMFLMVDINTTVSKAEAFESILPDASDALLAEFDAGYDFGTVKGHRIWSRMSTGQWGLIENEKSTQAFAEFVLVVRFDKTI